MTGSRGHRRGPASQIRVGLLTPYFSFFDDRFGPGFRTSQEVYCRGLVSALEQAGFIVIWSGLVDGAGSASETQERFRDGGASVVVVAATMAAPPSYGWEALLGFDGPILIWDDRRIASFDPHLDEVEATRTSSLLGSVMLASVLRREGRAFVTVSTTSGDASEVVRAVVGAAAAAGIKGARIGLLGGTIAGYSDVELGTAEADGLGIELVTLNDAVIEEALAASRLETSAGQEHRADLPDLAPGAAQLLERSLRVHRFLDEVTKLASLDALALNCHSGVLRWGDELGVVGCLAASLLWTEGVPVACTGDAATTVALMVAQSIAGSAQYCEGYAVESASGEMLLSSCGMADLSLRPTGEAGRLSPNDLYPGRHGKGLAVQFGFRPGPATIIGFRPAKDAGSACFVFAAGNLTGRWFSNLNGPSGMFTFDRPGAGTTTASWISSGPAHHVALVQGDRRTELKVAGVFLGVQIKDVTLADQGELQRIYPAS